MDNAQLLVLIKRYINLQKLFLDNTSVESHLAKQKAEVILEKIKTVCLTTHDRLLSISQDKAQLSFYAEHPDSLYRAQYSSGEKTHTSSKSSTSSSSYNASSTTYSPPHNSSSQESSSQAPFLSRGHLMLNVFLREAMELVRTKDKGMQPLEKFKDQLQEIAERTRAWVESRPSELFQQEGPPPSVDYFLNLFQLRYNAYTHFNSMFAENSVPLQNVEWMSC